MCGIVTYFGGAGNNLTRVLTGMSTIIYRAPDSMGIAAFGDDTETIRSRKSVGAMTQLLEKLTRNVLYPCPEAHLASLLMADNQSGDTTARQRRLLVFEGLTPEYFDRIQAGRESYLNFDDLVNQDSTRQKRLCPGWPGAPLSKLEFAIRSKKEFVELIQYLISEFDLSPTAIQLIIRSALQRVVDGHAARNALELRADDILRTFDEIYEKILTGERISPPRRLDYGFPSKSLYPHRYVWRYLIQSPIQIPSDYDRDGVRCVFRLLDAALLSRLAHNSLLSERLQQILDAFWPESQRPWPVQWRSLYAVEKGLNLFGWAAATALAYLQREDFLPEYLDAKDGRELIEAEAIVAGQTDPVSLRYFSPPILAHGRWAVQSAVTEKNAHPFTDEPRQRVLVLNGQFDSEIEAEVRHFLKNVAGMSLRSDNSSECLALLWGYYAQRLFGEQQHGDGIQSQVAGGLEQYAIGTQAMDYGVYQQVRGKTRDQIDQMALIQAAARMCRNGGQLAVAAMSLRSPRKMYVVSHNRPIFIVHRLDNDDFMAVSDINAAMGLFPQELIQQRVRELQKQHDRLTADMEQLRVEKAAAGRIETLKQRHRQAEDELLASFKVAVYPLEGERLFAVIESILTGGNLSRRLTLSDFEGRPLSGIEPFVTCLNPVQFRKDFQRSFYETHLAEIPERLNEMLRFYQTDSDTLLDFGVHTKKLRRRFGRHFGGLRRIILVGTGSAYNMGQIAKNFIRALMPDIDIVLLRPGEAEDLSDIVVPEKDLVLMLSWSSTTADMVKTAKQLLALNTLMVGVTGKTFGDMALMTYKSGGVLPILSGEEVTVSSIKSSICMLFCIHLFCVWLAAVKGRRAEARREMTRLQDIPAAVEALLGDQDLKAQCQQLVGRYAGCRAAIVIDAQKFNGMGQEIALKLEENSWTAIGKTLDYSEATPIIEKALPPGVLVLVNATCKQRLDDAVDVMERLFRRGIEFVTVSIAHRQQALLDKYSQGRAIILQRMPESLQPFVDLTLYYQFAFFFGLAQGREIGVPPRNRAKSLTISRSLDRNQRSSSERLQVLKETNQAGAGSDDLLAQASAPTRWEQNAAGEVERRYYRQMRQLAEIIAAPPTTFSRLAGLDAPAGQRLREALFSDESDIDEIILVPLDRSADAATRTIADQWRRLIGFPFHVATPWEAAAHFPERALMILVTGTAPAARVFDPRLIDIGAPFLWVGPEPVEGLPPESENSIGRFGNGPPSDLPPVDLLISQLNEIFIRLWQLVAPEKAAVVDRHVQLSAQSILAVLNDIDLLGDIRRSMADNAGYRTAFFIGPPNGTGTAWTACFDRYSPVILEHHPYGHSAHGPLVTVDPRVDQKFVKLEARRKMTARYGEAQVAEWERDYLGGTAVDAFLSRQALPAPHDWRQPFYAEESYFLPVLQPDYQTVEDNLIILDTTSQMYIHQAVDEMATFGCRYPRMITLSQSALTGALRDAAVFRFPVSSLILLPALGSGDRLVPLSELHLPYCLNLTAMAMAQATRDISDAHPSGSGI